MPLKLVFIFNLLLFTCLIVGCQEAADENISSSPIPFSTATTTHTAVEHKPIEPTLTASPEPTQTTELDTVEICTPLQYYSFAELENAIVNPYLPPPPGVDRPHQGIDLAVRDELTNVAVAGSQVQAILPGKVRMVIHNRFPYGYAILVETDLQGSIDLDEFLNSMPTAWAEFKPDPALTCPIYEGPILDNEQRSIYILYAHLEEMPTVKVGSSIQCGEAIGEIGMSGNALNPHVHIEARIGPSGATFESMAHYDASATTEEMAAYCQWRVSGSFQHFDPMFVLGKLLETQNP